ncbi:MAG: murein biosynthesis integral membrane protein MurJ [Bdellovibrionaceae bacterium]|nr:murein biosynthesis integral membrane protein MurJ [Pseudobdellovibrionaceae bacterium]MDW8190494.1 murein biosynthesis integral membrane protein MurJ [Pseudobdellovibrionaceae bacterium]
MNGKGVGQKQGDPLDSEHVSPATSRVATQALFMSLGTATSRVLGLVRESLFAALFNREITDAWYVAFKLPNLFRRLFGEGSLSVSLIPILIQAQKEGRDRLFISHFFYVFSAFLVILSVLGIIFMEPILTLLLDHQYLANSHKFDVTLRMARTMFIYVYLVCSYALVLGVLNTLGRFGWPALAPAAFNLCLIGSMFVPEQWQSWSGQALAWGVVWGGVLQLGILVPLLIKHDYWPRLPRQGAIETYEVFKKMLPSLLGMGLMQLMVLVNVRFASQFESGIITYINFADRLLELPLSLISVSLGSALLPQLARLWQENRYQDFTMASVRHLRLNLFLSMGAAVGLVGLAFPIVEILFQRGQFSERETLITASILKVYAISVVFSSLVRVFVPCFYAVKNTWYPALVSGACLVIHIFLAPLLIKNWSYMGLVASTVAASVFNFLFLILGYRIFVGLYPWDYFLKGIIPMLPGAVVMYLVLLSYPYWQSWIGYTFWSKIVILVLLIGLSLLIYFTIARWLRLDEVTTLLKGRR